MHSPDATTKSAADALAALLEDSAEAVCALDRGWRCVYLNRAAERLWGVRRDELLGRDLWERFPVAVGGEAWRQCRRAAEGGAVAEFRSPWPGADGEIWVDARACPSPGGLMLHFRAAPTPAALSIETGPATADPVAPAGGPLRDAAAVLAGIGDAVPDFIWFTDWRGEVLYVNRHWTQYTGLSGADLANRGYARVIHPDDWAEFRRQADEGLREGKPFEGELRYRRHDGVYRWFWSRSVPLRDPATGRIEGRVGVARDVDDRRRAEAELRRSRDLLDKVFDLAPVGLSLVDDQGRLLRVNRAYAAIVGCTPAELAGRDYATLIAEEQRPVIEQRRLARLRGETPGPMDIIALVKDGTRRLVTAAATRLIDGADPAGGGLSLSVALDVTEQRRAERALREANERLAGVLDSITDRYIVLDEQFRFVEVNAAARQMVFGGRPLEELIGRGVWDLYPLGRSAVFYEAYRRAMERGEPVHTEGRSGVADRWFESHAYPRLGPPRRLEVYVRDITERKEAEAALRRAKEEAERCARAAEAASRAKDQFLAVLSHELRTPLTPVAMAVAALEADASLPAEVRDDLAMIRRNIELETKLIDDLLDVTRIVHGKLRLRQQAVDAHGLLAHVLDMLGADLADKRLRVDYDAAAADATVWGDPARLQQVFWNLVRNAVKFTPPGGRVGVLSQNPRPGVLRVEVVDDGLGIEPSMIPRLFDAFEQADPGVTRQFGGLGLGLAISKSLVDLHGGAIAGFSDGPGRGSRFAVELPTGAAARRLAERIQPTAGGVGVAAADVRPPPNGVRVLVVEDHADTSRMLRRLLEGMGYEVVTADGVAAALEVLGGGGDAAPPVDVLVSDIGLSDGSGHELMRRARALHGGLPGVAVSGYGMDNDLRESQAAGFAAHVTKPIDVDQLDEAIRAALGAREPKGAAPR